MAKKKTNRKPQYWLFKTEPNSYSIDDLASEKAQTTFWDGVRNYQARNMLRDDVQLGDGVLFYHSNAKPPAIVGAAKVVKAGYADHTQFDPKAKHYDENADPDEPTWYMVDIKFVQKFPDAIDRDQLAADKTAKNMGVLAKGSRLSILPVTEAEWKAVHKLAGVEVR
jgi:predicted RNA-binding protein with PUA-like domain